MLSEEYRADIRKRALELFDKAGIPLTQDERENKLCIVDYGADDYEQIGIVMMTTINAPRYSGRYIVFFPNQSCAQHWHPKVDGKPGKEETFRVLYGTVYTYGEGQPTKVIQATIPKGYEPYYDCRKEYILNAGDQYTVKPEEKHWFQAGDEGAIAYETASHAYDEYDMNSNPVFNENGHSYYD